MNEQQQIKTRIKELLEEHCFKDKNGNLYADIYADYRDELSEEQLKKITEADDSQQAFYEILDDSYEDTRYELEELIHVTVVKDEKLQKVSHNFCSCDELRDIMLDMFYVQIPYDHYQKQDVLIDILVDAGDLNFDYSLNNIGPAIYNNEGIIDDESGVLWLVNQQGYSKFQLQEFFKQPDKSQNFLYSVFQELQHLTSGMNALTFCVKISLEEYFKLQKGILKGKEEGYITLSNDTTCGLYDPWNGAGGLLEINLEKDVTLPIKNIESAQYDGGRGYSIQEIYGVTSGLWTDNAVKEIHFNGEGNNDA